MVIFMKLKLIKTLKNLSTDFSFKYYKINNNELILIYNKPLNDESKINNFILKPLSNIKDFKHLDLSFPNINIKKIKLKSLLSSLLEGSLILIYKNIIYETDTKTSLDRGIQTIESELSITGPKDSFTENYNTNIALIRKRLKTSSLKITNLTLGTITKTKIGILSLSGIVKASLPKNIINHLNNINIDGIIDSSYLKKALEKKYTLFPTIIQTERPDKASLALLEGKVVIVTENSPYILILPSLFIDFFHTTDDYYQKSINTSFIRIIRLFAFIIAIFTPAIYIAVTTRNYDLIPLKLLMTLKAGRTYVPFPAYIEALFMIICFEILKESDLRMSSTTGSAISILGGLILGDAAVSAGIVSPIMIIVIAISSISALTFQSIELSNAIRSYKILLLLFSTILGINGILIATTLLLFNLLTLKVFGIPYLTPIIPLEKNEIKDSLIKLESHEKYRNSYLTNNTKRGHF